MNVRSLLAISLPCLLLAACLQAESRNASRPEDSVIGIVQCDDYFAKINTCIQDNVPAGKRAALTAEARQVFNTWKEAGAKPEHRATLPQACAITHEVARDEFAQYGCAL